MVPRAEGAGTNLTPTASAVNWANKGLAKIIYKINEHRLDRDTDNALRAALPDAGKMLEETGARGVLLEARYVRDKDPAAPESGPSNLTQTLGGGKLHLLGAGGGPVAVLAVALFEPSIDFADTEKSQRIVSDATRDW
jgi:hypothetical protein